MRHLVLHSGMLQGVYEDILECRGVLWHVESSWENAGEERRPTCAEKRGRGAKGLHMQG